MCTDFRLKPAIDGTGTLVSARSLEFGIPLDSAPIKIYKGTKITSSTPTDPDGGGLTWQTKYEYVGMNGYNSEFVGDGLNAEGLSVGGLNLYETMYSPTVKVPEKALNAFLLTDWLLGNCASVAEARIAIFDPSVIEVWGSVEQSTTLDPLHFSLHDRHGDSAVIEYIDGLPIVYPNPYGVLTNSPVFPWQTDNLRNFVGLTPWDPAPQDVTPLLKMTQPGHGGGLRGIPGDYTPPSRFVRIFNLKEACDPATSWDTAVMQAFHLLNTVDIPKGTIRYKIDGIPQQDYTQWAVVKDLTNRVFYSRMYDSPYVTQIMVGPDTGPRPLGAAPKPLREGRKAKDPVAAR